MSRRLSRRAATPGAQQPCTRDSEDRRRPRWRVAPTASSPQTQSDGARARSPGRRRHIQRSHQAGRTQGPQTFSDEPCCSLSCLPDRSQRAGRLRAVTLGVGRGPRRTGAVRVQGIAHRYRHRAHPGACPRAAPRDADRRNRSTASAPAQARPHTPIFTMLHPPAASAPATSTTATRTARSGRSRLTCRTNSTVSSTLDGQGITSASDSTFGTLVAMFLCS